jgi:hypothetical protein
MRARIVTYRLIASACVARRMSAKLLPPRRGFTVAETDGVFGADRWRRD